MANWRLAGLIAAGAVFNSVFFGSAVLAQDTREAKWPEVDTKYIFGFTEGTSVGDPGEKEFSAETFVNFGKADGHYTASSTRLEFEYTPAERVQFEVGPLVSTHDISGVSGMDDRHSLAFQGLFGELRYLVLEHSATSPVAVTLSVEPVWRRIDETTGDRVTNFELETKLSADTELVADRLFLGFNAIYEPEMTRTPDTAWANESQMGLSTAVAVRPIAPLLIGAEVEYFRHYSGIAFNSFTGDAVYLGPTFYLKLSPKTFMTAAWSTQIGGHAVDEIGGLNLADFSRNRAKLKFAFEF